MRVVKVTGPSSVLAMDGTFDRRQALKLVGSVAVTGGLAGCTLMENVEQSGTESSPQNQTQAQSSTQRTTQPTEHPHTTTSTQTKTSTQTTPEKKGPQGTLVSVSTPDGRTVTGTLYGSGSCGVVFVPGVGYDKSDWKPQARKVASAGHTALALDMNFDKRPQNVQTTIGGVSHLQTKQNAKTIVLVGASAGANAVVKANTNPDVDADGSVIIAPGKAEEYAPDLSGRKLFIVGKNDEERFVQTTKMMHERASQPKKLVTLSTGKHAQGIFSTSQGSKLTKYIVDFVATTCSSESK